MLISALCGLLVAAIALPAIGGATAGAKAAQAGIGDLGLAFDPPAQSQRSKVLDANGHVLAYFYDENRVYVGLDKISPVMRQAIVSIEDHRFYEHGPLDAQGTLRAFITNLFAGGVTQGGSTLTQQYVKMVTLEAAKQSGDAAAVKEATSTSYQRKLRELRYAVSVEKTLSKDQILERYLNIAYYGDGAYGIEVAAEHYFGTTAAKLTLPQAAMLAGLVQNPNGYDPVTNRDAGIARRNVVLDRMAELGAATPAAVAKAKATKFDASKAKRTLNGCQGTKYPFVCDYVYRSLEQTASLGSTVEQRQQTIQRGGLTIQTELDPATQKTVQKQVSKAVGATDPVIAAMDMVQPGTGMIVAMAQSRPVMGTKTKKGQTYWNYSVPPSMGGAQGFQAGSTFKAFTAAAALAKGIPLSQQFDAQSTMNFSGATFDSCAGQTSVSGNWQVSNSTGVNGVMDMNKAAEFSVNTYFVQLALKVGMCDVTKMAEKLGVESSTADAPISSYDDKPSFTLGTVEVSPLSMAEAYATFASGGIHCDPIIVSKITDSSGANRAATGANCHRVISSDVANTMSSLLSKVMTSGTGRRALTGDGRPEAGKTGTIDSNAAVWFVGYTPQVAGAAMISIDNTRAPFIRTASGYERGLKGYTVPSTGLYLEGSGSGDAGQDIWKPAMQKYLSGKPVENFDPAPASLVYGQNQGYGYGPGAGQIGTGQTGTGQPGTGQTAVSRDATGPNQGQPGTGGR